VSVSVQEANVSEAKIIVSEILILGSFQQISVVRYI